MENFTNFANDSSGQADLNALSVDAKNIAQSHAKRDIAIDADTDPFQHLASARINTTHTTNVAVSNNSSTPSANTTDLTSPIASKQTPEDIIAAKAQLESELAQKRASMRLKESEMKTMQNEIEAYNQMVKQLDQQRDIAVTKLSEMNTQIEELRKQFDTERIKVETKDQELKTKRDRLQTLKSEETTLQEDFRRCSEECDSTTKDLVETQLQITKVKAKLLEMEEFKSQTDDRINDLNQAINNKDTIRLSALISQIITPPIPLDDLRSRSSSSRKSDGQSQSNGIAGQNSNLPFFEDSDAFGNDPFANDDPFKGDDPFRGDDPFKSDSIAFALPENDPFNPASAFFANLPSNDPFAPTNPSAFGR